MEESQLWIGILPKLNQGLELIPANILFIISDSFVLDNHSPLIFYKAIHNFDEVLEAVDFIEEILGIRIKLVQEVRG